MEKLNEIYEIEREDIDETELDTTGRCIMNNFIHLRMNRVGGLK